MNNEDFMEGFADPNEEELTREEREHQERVEDKKMLDKITRGVNDTFIKEYKFDDLDLEFTIKLKAPNAVQTGRINGMVASYLGGTQTYQSDYIRLVYHTLACIRVLGEDVPKELEKDEDIYNLDILFQIGRDFQQWLNKFCR